MKRPYPLAVLVTIFLAVGLTLGSLLGIGYTIGVRGKHDAQIRLSRALVALEAQKGLTREYAAHLAESERRSREESDTIRALVEDNDALAAELAKPRDIPSLIRSVAESHGLSRADSSALVEIARAESTFRPSARNGKCLGLFQLKTTDARWRDPAWNTAAAILYMKHRYGSPTAALTFRRAHGWY